MARKGKALTRKITRKRAMSYDRMAPNKRGVTALSEVNGRGAYRKRYRKTRRKLEENLMPKRRRTSKRRRTAAMKPNLKQGGKRVKKADYIARQRRKGRSVKQAENDWRLASGAHKRSKARKKKGRTYGKGKYKALKARVGGPGGRSKYTYFYRTKKGRTRKIPDHALLGYRSAREMLEVQRTGSERERAALSRRMQALLDRRIKAGERSKQRAIEGKNWFSPNPGDPDVLTFEEWNSMKRNPRKSKKKTSKKRSSSRHPRYGTKDYYKWLSKKSQAARKRKSGGTKKRSTTRRKASTKRKASSKKRSTKRTSSRRPRYGTKDYYRWLGKKGAAARKRKSGSTSKKRRTTRRKTSSKRRVRVDSMGRRITAKRRAASRRNLKKACGTVRRMKANKRGSYKRRSKAITRRRSSGTSVTRKRRRSMKPNAMGAAYKMELKNAIKYGVIVLGGFVVHRALTNVVDKYALSKVSALQSGAAATWRKSLSGLLVALVGVPIALRTLPKHAGVAAAGMGASLLYDVILTGLHAAKLDNVAEAIAAYPDAPGYPQYSGMGSYYEYAPHQVFSGMGDYYETSYVPGLEQAAAGMGAAGSPQMLTQAAAGLQQMYANPMGEYYATGAEGIGEYEAAPATAPAFNGYIDDGIQPNLHSAEQMLDVAEAAAGVGNADILTQAAAGFGDLPLQSTVQPMIRAMDIPDGPGGTRAGILQGNDGIFG